MGKYVGNDGDAGGSVGVGGGAFVPALAMLWVWEGAPLLGSLCWVSRVDAAGTYAVLRLEC